CKQAYYLNEWDARNLTRDLQGEVGSSSFSWDTRFRAGGCCTIKASNKGLPQVLRAKKSLGSTHLYLPSDSNCVRPSKPESLAEHTCHQNQEP
ncbi:hypothetical protein STEG23_012226, partial [Scotinomys teguina]